MRILFILTLLLFTGCIKKPLEISQTENKEFAVEKLFTFDGCTVYRFSDDGGIKYFTNCKGSV